MKKRKEEMRKEEIRRFRETSDDDSHSVFIFRKLFTIVCTFGNLPDDFFLKVVC